VVVTGHVNGRGAPAVFCDVVMMARGSDISEPTSQMYARAERGVIFSLVGLGVLRE
jgi:hypothetical protein